MAKNLESADRVITAKDARNISDTTQLFLKRIFKAITEVAKEGRTTIYWDRTDISPVLLSSVVDKLTKLGYDISLIESSLRVSW